MGLGTPCHAQFPVIIFRIFRIFPFQNLFPPDFITRCEGLAQKLAVAEAVSRDAMRRLEEPPRKGCNGRKGSHAAFVTLILCRLCFANLWQPEPAPIFATSDTSWDKARICTIFFVHCYTQWSSRFQPPGIGSPALTACGSGGRSKARVLEGLGQGLRFFRFLSLVAHVEV